jgi:hypothetical protein
MIDFTPGLRGTITLSSATLVISQNTTIIGPGADQITISGNNNFQIFYDSYPCTFAVSGLTFANGVALIPPADIIDFVLPPPAGGAIFNEGGTVTVTNCVFNNCQATTTGSEGGAVFNTWFGRLFPPPPLGPPGIPGTMSLQNCAFTNNVANTSFGGAVANDSGCSLTMTSCSLMNNRGTDLSGGALFNAGPNALYLLGSAVASLTDCTVANNVTLASLQPGLGAGIYNSGFLTLTRTTVANNIGPTNGGGIYDLGVSGSPSSLTAINCTIANNRATNSDGGGIWDSNGDVTLTNCTVAGNISARGGGLFIALTNVPQIVLKNTIVARNTAPTRGPDIFGTVNQATNNLVRDGSGSTGIVNGVNGNQVGTTNLPINPLLGNLQYNGGPTLAIDGTRTLTMALLTGSPAIDAGTNLGAPPTDERNTGFNRPINGTVDIGAYEYQPPLTQTGLMSSLNPAIQGQTVTFTATVTVPAPGSNSPSGTVSFFDGSTLLATVNLLSNGTASYTTSSLPLGSHSISALYNGLTIGDYRLSPSTSSPVVEVIVRASATTLASALNPANTNQTVRLTATVNPQSGSGTPTGTVTFLDGSTSLGMANLSANQAILDVAAFVLTPGTHVLTAQYSGDTNFGMSTSGPVNQVVGPTTIAVVSSMDHSNVTDSITFTATVTAVVTGGLPISGNVDFFDGTMSIGNGVLSGNTATVNVPGFTPGTHVITARYNGDSNYTPSTSLAINQIVGATTTMLVSDHNPSSVGDTVTFTATVTPQVAGGPPLAGNVDFFDGTNPLGTVALSGNTASLPVNTLTPGHHAITARYDGDPVNYTGSTSDAVTQTVGPTVTMLVSGPNPSNVNDMVTFTAAVTSQLGGPTPTGSVTFFDGTTMLGSMNLDTGGTASFSYNRLTGGMHTITATYSGSPTYADSVSNAVMQTVMPLATTTTLINFPATSPVNQPVTFMATVTFSGSGPLTPGGQVTFFDGGSALATVNLVSGTASYTTSSLRAGRHTITAQYLGDSNFLASPPSQAGTLRVIPVSFFAVGGAPGRVRVYRPDGTLLYDFAPYPGYTGPINVAVGDVTGDGIYDIVTGAAVGNPDVRVYNGAAMANHTFDPNNPNAPGSLVVQFFAYGVNFNVGANVAVGDVSGNGFADIVTGATVGNPDVHIYSGQDIAAGRGPRLLAQFFAYGVNFNIGANVAVGNITNNRFADVVTGATAGNPDVHVYRGQDLMNGQVTLLAQFFAYGLNFNVGAYVAVGDTNGDGFGDVITGASRGNPDVRVWDGRAIANGTFNTNTGQLDQFFAYGLNSNSGVTVGSADFEGTGNYDILTGSTNSPHYRVVHGNASGTMPPAIFEGTIGDMHGGISVGA